jgi:DNA-binding PadR family transcriptional regulator
MSIPAKLVGGINFRKPNNYCISLSVFDNITNRYIERRKMLKDFFLGFIKIHILYHASKTPVYGLWLIEELGEHGYRLSPGTLYPILHKLEEEQFLESFSENVEGKIRKYYKMTSKGEKALSEARQKIKELISEVME